MKVPLSWLQTYFKTELSPEMVSEAFLSAGLEVEACDHLGKGFDRVVVGEVQSADPHPNADKLRVCQVDVGTANEGPLTIVCGAHNFEAGAKVPVSMVGAKLPNGMSIKKGKIRGEASEGMICSESELGLAETSEGIMVLSGDATPGEKVDALLGLDDWVLDLFVTPNRGDCLSVEGLVRDLGAKLGIATSLRQVSENAKLPSGSLSVSIQAKELCPRYSLRKIKILDALASSSDMLFRLKACGLRPVHPIVDVTNYVMLETGQPLHAFDAAKVQGDIVVRQAKEEEPFQGLDGQAYVLSSDDLVIADETKVLAIAGVMGGMDSSVDEKTETVLLESAHFDPSSVRKTARKFALHTDSSHRFERFVDPWMVAKASDRAFELMQSIGKVESQDTTDVLMTTFQVHRIALEKDQISSIAGQEIPHAGELLQRLGFSVQKLDAGFSVDVPPRRPDIERPIDLIEEVIRLNGFDSIPSELPPSYIEGPVKSFRHRYQMLDSIKGVCAGLGFAEFQNYSFEDQSLFNPDVKGVEIANPVSAQMTHMKSDLASGVLHALARNLRHQQSSVRGFEVNRVYLQASKSEVTEETHLVLAFAGKAAEKEWYGSERAFDFFDLKGSLERLFLAMNWGPYRLKAAKLASTLHAGQSFEVQWRNRKVGILARLALQEEERLDLRHAYFLELNLEPFFEGKPGKVSFKPFSEYPGVRRDLAFWVPKTCQVSDIDDVLGKVKLPNLRSFEVFDVFEDVKGASDKKSCAYRFRFEAMDRTLEESDVNASMEKIQKVLVEKLSADLRN